MNKTDIDKLRERLNWYIYECPYSEYNEQEVNYIVEELKKAKDDYEIEIDSSHYSFPLSSLQHEKKLAQRHKTRNTIIASLGTLAIASSLFFAVFLRDQATAGLKIDFFNFLKSEEKGIQFYFVPDNTKKYKVYDIEELPDKLKDSVWIPDELLATYIIYYIEIYNNNIISVCYKDTITKHIIEIYYNQQTDNNENKYTLIEQFDYKDILIDHIQVLPVENNEHIFSFYYMGNDYFIFSDCIDDVNSVVYKFIDFIVSK